MLRLRRSHPPQPQLASAESRSWRAQPDEHAHSKPLNPGSLQVFYLVCEVFRGHRLLRLLLGSHEILEGALLRVRQLLLRVLCPAQGATQPTAQ